MLITNFAMVYSTTMTYIDRFLKVKNKGIFTDAKKYPVIAKMVQLFDLYNPDPAVDEPEIHPKRDRLIEEFLNLLLQTKAIKKAMAGLESIGTNHFNFGWK